MLSRDLKDRNKEQAYGSENTVWLSDGLLSIDLNCDMGEGMDNDALLMPFISSANIACGYHAGDESIMRRTVQLALAHKVAIGAHPSYPDRENFGRLDLLDAASAPYTGQPPSAQHLTPEDLPAIITAQLAALHKICSECRARLHHVKLHGALYNRAARDTELSMLICRTIAAFDPSLLLYGPGSSALEEAAAHFDIAFVKEAFADRTYREDGSLTPRTEPNALIADTAQSVSQVLKIVSEGKVRTADDKEIPLMAQTICVHGDGSHALPFAQAIHETLLQHLITVQAP